MITEVSLAAFVVLRWNTLEADITTFKHLVNHFAIPFVRSALLHVKDSLCGRHPKPGMRPPSIQLNTSTTQKEQ